jgi:hypothetical protein
MIFGLVSRSLVQVEIKIITYMKQVYCKILYPTLRGHQYMVFK